MKSYFCKLTAPRVTFLRDMSADEVALMQAHGAYWKDWMARGHVVSFGMVADPAGAFGAGFLEFEDEAAVQAFTSNDPTIRSGKGFRMEVHPMPMGIVVRQT